MAADWVQPPSLIDKKIMAKELKELKQKSKWPHQQLVEVEFIVDVKSKAGELIAAKGSKQHVGNKAAKELVEAKRAKIVA